MRFLVIQRREVLAGTLAIGVSNWAGSAKAGQAHRADISAEIEALELGAARLGLCLLDTATGERAGRRMDEHFAMCSTFKLALVAAYLREADAGRLNLSEMVPYTEGDLLEWSPVTRESVGKGAMSIEALARAAQQLSDGTAANLLVKRLGGPAAYTAKVREMGDPVTRLDRYEPDLGLVLSADLRDTTQPQAYAELVRQILTGNVLVPGSRRRLLQWMVGTQTGARRLRAGLPAGWVVGNKTGTGRAAGTTNKCNDVAIVYPPDRAPVIIAAYFDSGEYTDQTETRHEAVLAEVGKLAARWAASG